MNDLSNRLQRDLRRGIELEDAVRLLRTSRASSATRSVVKLPVWLNRWASARLSYACLSSASARFRSSMSMISPYQYAIRPSVS